MDWGALEARRPDITAWLTAHTAVALPDTHDRFRLFDVGCRK